MSELITAYQIRNLLNARLKEIGVERIVAGPQLYNYCKNGLVDGIKREKMTGVLIELEKATEWIEKYLGNNYPEELAASVTPDNQISLDELVGV